MITDDKTKEELEKLTSQFNDTYYINLVTRSFNAGLRAAERLAKIEVLEELKETLHPYADRSAIWSITRKIDELKADN